MDALSRTWPRLATCSALLACLAGPAVAKPALCTTTDDGTYPCEFRSTDGRGSFRVSAPGKPTYIVDVMAPGRAGGFVVLGARTVALPGPYRLAPDGSGCWVSDATAVRICAK